MIACDAPLWNGFSSQIFSERTLNRLLGYQQWPLCVYYIGTDFLLTMLPSQTAILM